MDTIRDMIAAQRAELAEVLAGLPAPSWDEPTLCAGWRVREAVAHDAHLPPQGRGMYRRIDTCRIETRQSLAQFRVRSGIDEVGE